jgi:ABC-type uncharacterized transport system permease subunit
MIDFILLLVLFVLVAALGILFYILHSQQVGLEYRATDLEKRMEILEHKIIHGSHGSDTSV